MMHRIPRHLTCLVVILMIAGLTGWAQAQQKPATMTVTGRGVVSAPADQLSLSVGATATGASLGEVRSDVDTRQARIVKALEGLGLKAGTEFRTSAYSITPQWNRSRAGSRSNQPQTPELIGYMVRSTIAITTPKLDLAGKIIEAAVSAGANDIGSIAFTIAETRVLRDQAIEQAAGLAKRDARVLAAATDCRIVKVLELSIDRSGIIYKSATSRTATASAAVVVPGLVDINATVTIVYEIESASSGQE